MSACLARPEQCMAIPRRFLAVAVGALAAGAVIYMRNRMREAELANTPRRRAEAPVPPAPAPASTTATGPAPAAAPAGASGELSQFLAGDIWHDDAGWRSVWGKDGVADAGQWLRSTGKDVLAAERTKLADQPALLAGCRRRWIVVCRYAGLEVAEAAALWNNTAAA